MTAVVRDRRFTLRGRIGGRQVRRVRRTPRAVLMAVGVYVLSAAVGWAAVGVLIAMVMR